jgi:SpoVK/Ycf46/Vps4 family AAA+-type ATPase
LTDRELRAAEAKNLVRADVKRREVEEFRRALRQDYTERRLELQKRRESLLAKMRQIQDELRQIEDELGGDIIEGDAVVIEQMGDRQI